MKRLALALAALIAASPAAADTLIDNANGIQVGPDGQLQRFRALVIGDDGKVRAVLASTENVRLANITRTVDAGGRTLLPGLIDAHLHLAPLGQTETQLTLNGIGSLEDMKAALRAFAEANPDSAWIVGRGWNEELWTPKRLPTAADFDSAVPDRPVWLYRADGHSAVANSEAMRIAGVSAVTSTPPGGDIGRDSAGAPTGLFVDTARPLIEAHVPPPSEAEQEATILAAQRMLLKQGITAVANLRTPPEDWRTLDRLGRTGRLALRVAAYGYTPEGRPIPEAPRPTGWLYGDHLRMVGIKLYADGALGSRGAWLKAPYSDAPDSRGLSLHSDAKLLGLARDAAQAELQVAIHGIGDAANAQAIAVFEQLARAFPGRRWRLEHAQILDPADIRRLAPAGIVASMQPVHQISDREMAQSRLGPARLAGAYAWQSIARSGATLAFGSDAPFDSPSPFVGLMAAVSRQDLEGQPRGGWLPQERLSFAQALSAFTRGAAYAGFAEDRIGSLEPGKWADFIIVDRDVGAVGPQELGRTKVLETWVGGEKVWEASAPGERG